MSNIKQHIALTEQKLALLKEYEQSAIYENCTHDIVKGCAHRTNWFFLVEIASQSIVREGTRESINKYITTRNIATDKVYNY